MKPQLHFRGPISVPRRSLIFFAFLPLMFILFESCTDKCETSTTYLYYKPVYKTLEELRSGVELVGPQAVKAVGKIYFKNGFLFVNEPGEGIHVIDNRDPAAPKQTGFVKIPGSYELAIK